MGPSWGDLGPSWAYVGPSWAYVGPSGGYVGPSWGPCWPILRAMLARVRPSWAIRSEKRPKMGRAQNTVKRGGFWRGGSRLRQGRRPLSPTERREPPTAMPRPGGPWPDLSAYARQPARGPTMLAHLVAMLAYVGVCWPILRATWAHLVAMLAYVCLMLAHVEPKDPKNGNSKKTP